MRNKSKLVAGFAAENIYLIRNKTKINETGSGKTRGFEKKWANKNYEKFKKLIIKIGIIKTEIIKIGIIKNGRYKNRDHFKRIIKTIN